jgi:hypothetical protein
LIGWAAHPASKPAAGRTALEKIASGQDAQRRKRRPIRRRSSRRRCSNLRSDTAQSSGWLSPCSSVAVSGWVQVSPAASPSAS